MGGSQSERRKKREKERKKKQAQATAATNPNEEKLVGNGKETPKSDKTGCSESGKKTEMRGSVKVPKKLKSEPHVELVGSSEKRIQAGHVVPVEETTHKEEEEVMLPPNESNHRCETTVELKHEKNGEAIRSQKKLSEEEMNELQEELFPQMKSESVHGEVTSMNSDGSITKFGHPQHNEEYDNSKHDAAEQQLELELKKPIKKLEFASTTRKLPKQNVDYVCIDHQTDTQLLRVPNTEPVGINRQLGDHGKAPKEDNEQLLRDHIRKQNTVIQQQKAHNEQLMCRQNELETTNHKLQDRIRELEADRQQRRDCISFAVKHVLFKEDMKRGKTKKHTIIVVSRQEYQHCFALGHRFKLRNKMFITTKPLYIICVELDENDQPMDVIEGPAFIKFATNEAETQVKHLENYFSEYDQTSVDSLFLTNCPYPYNENISNASMVALFKDKCDVAIDEKCVECEKRNNGIKIKFQNDSDRLKVFLNAKEKLVSTDTNIEVWLTEYQQIQRLILKRVKIPYEDDGKGNLYVETSEGREHVDTLGRVFEIAEHCQNDQFW